MASTAFWAAESRLSPWKSLAMKPGATVLTVVPCGVSSRARSCLLTPYAVVDDQCGQGDAAEVGQGVFVVAGSDAAPVFESVEAALDGVAVSVQVRVEPWWSTAG